MPAILYAKVGEVPGPTTVYASAKGQDGIVRPIDFTTAMSVAVSMREMRPSHRPVFSDRAGSFASPRTDGGIVLPWQAGDFVTAQRYEVDALVTFQDLTEIIVPTPGFLIVEVDERA